MPQDATHLTHPTMHMVVTAAEDHQLGGRLMGIVGGIFFIMIASIFFLRWMPQQEQEQQATERARDDTRLDRTGIDLTGAAESFRRWWREHLAREPMINWRVNFEGIR